MEISLVILGLKNIEKELVIQLLCFDFTEKLYRNSHSERKKLLKCILKNVISSLESHSSTVIPGKLRRWQNEHGLVALVQSAFYMFIILLSCPLGRILSTTLASSGSRVFFFIIVVKYIILITIIAYSHFKLHSILKPSTSKVTTDVYKSITNSPLINISKSFRRGICTHMMCLAKSNEFGYDLELLRCLQALSLS